MMRVWAISVAVIAAFLVHSMAGYVQESSALHELSKDTFSPSQSKPRRVASTRIDGTWLTAELPKLKSEASTAAGFRN